MIYGIKNNLKNCDPRTVTTANKSKEFKVKKGVTVVVLSEVDGTVKVQTQEKSPRVGNMPKSSLEIAKPAVNETKSVTKIEEVQTPCNAKDINLFY
jgi:3-deoxy-D-manno-octulosonate 8-phosphate phosphatase KdsC-like HAD superfamily phosphatase